MTETPMQERQRLLLKEIERAFEGVELGEGIGLRETVVIDNYGSEEERLAAQALDERRDWRKLVVDPAIRELSGVGGIHFFDAPGLRFHLPAYLWLAVTDYPAKNWNSCESFLFCLTRLEGWNRDRSLGYWTANSSIDHRLRKLEIFDEAQRRIVRHVLMFIRDVHEPDDEVLESAIDGYWSTDGKFDDPHYAIDFS